MAGAKDISYLIIDGIFDTLNANVTVNAVTYPVYKTIPISVADTYVKIGEVIETEDGTKDTFIYQGSVSINVVDKSLTKQGDRKLAQSILNKVRSLLKTGKGTNPSISGLVTFSLNGKTEMVDFTDKARPEVRITDIYTFTIE
jgi:hypothetical protein